MPGTANMKPFFSQEQSMKQLLTGVYALPLAECWGVSSKTRHNKSLFSQVQIHKSQSHSKIQNENEQIIACFYIFLGVLVLSWYPPGLADDNGEPTEDMVPAVLDAAYRHNLKVRASACFVCTRQKERERNLKYSTERARDS